MEEKRINGRDATKVLTAKEFEKLFTSFEVSAFRLETLTAYSVEAEDHCFDAFIRGKPLPPDQNEDWCKIVRTNIAAGKKMQRVHLLPEKLTPYIRYEIEWGYVFNAAAGEAIHFILPWEVTDTIREVSANDFWLFDDNKVVVMNYGSGGEYTGQSLLTEPLAVERHVHARSLILERAISLEDFLARYRAGKIQ